MYIDRNRVLHMHGVAEYMAENATRFDLPADKMYLLGYIHDIGYFYGKENHEENGAALVEFDYGKWIWDHGITPEEYIEKYRIPKDKIPREQILLWEADMSVDLNGENVGFKKRLEDIGKRHGTDSKAYRMCCQTIHWLSQYRLLHS